MLMSAAETSKATVYSSFRIAYLVAGDPPGRLNVIVTAAEPTEKSKLAAHLAAARRTVVF